MQLLKTVTLLALATMGIAAAAPEPEALAKRGFGCPDDGPCNDHVCSIFPPKRGIEAFANFGRTVH